MGPVAATTCRAESWVVVCDENPGWYHDPTAGAGGPDRHRPRAPLALVQMMQMRLAVRRAGWSAACGLGSRIRRFLTAAPASFCRCLTPGGADGVLARAVRTR